MIQHMKLCTDVAGYEMSNHLDHGQISRGKLRNWPHIELMGLVQRKGSPKLNSNVRLDSQDKTNIGAMQVTSLGM